MRRPLVIALVLMGGGALAAGVALPNRNRDCQQARAAQAPNADEICARSSSSRGGSGGGRTLSWFGTGPSSVAGTVAAGARGAVSNITRGGFGAAGRFFSSGGG